MSTLSARRRFLSGPVTAALLVALLIAVLIAVLTPAGAFAARGDAAGRGHDRVATSNLDAGARALRTARHRRNDARRAFEHCLQRRGASCAARRRHELERAKRRLKALRTQMARIALNKRSGKGRAAKAASGTKGSQSNTTRAQAAGSNAGDDPDGQSDGANATSHVYATDPGAPVEMGLVPASMSSPEPSAIQQLGAHTVRMEFEIGAPASELAPTVEEYAKVGIRILPLAGFYGTLPTASQAQNLASWAATFGPGGSFWKGKSFSPTVAITDIEFGNETSYGYQYSSSSEAAIASRAQTYALRFQTAEEAIQKSDPDVGLLAQGDEGNSGPAWVENMFKAVPDLGELVAGWTIHPYGPEWKGRIERLINQTEAAGAPSTVPIYVTEWGLASDNGRCLGENYGWNPCMTYGEAASTLTSTVAGMRESFGGRLRAIYLYQAHDLSASGGSNVFSSYFGVRQYDGAPKGAYTSAVEALFAEGS